MQIYKKLQFQSTYPYKFNVNLKLNDFSLDFFIPKSKVIFVDYKK